MMLTQIKSGLIILILALAAVACGPPKSDGQLSAETENIVKEMEADGNVILVEPAKQTIDVRHPSGERSKLQLIPLGSPSQVAEFAEQVRQSGFSCDQSSSVNQLRQLDNQDLPIYKIDCENGNSYELTILNDKPYLKPWNGVLIGMQ